MFTTRIGDSSKASMRQEEIYLLWHGLKALHEFGQAPNTTGVIDEILLKNLIGDLETAHAQYSDRWGPISDQEIRERLDRCRHLVDVWNNTTKPRLDTEVERVRSNVYHREQEEGNGKLTSKGVIAQDVPLYLPDDSHIPDGKDKATMVKEMHDGARNRDKLHSLQKAQTKLEAVEQNFNSLSQERDELIGHWNQEYERPLAALHEERNKVWLSLKPVYNPHMTPDKYKEMVEKRNKAAVKNRKYSKLTKSIEEFKLKRNDSDLVSLRDEIDAKVRAVAKMVPTLMEAKRKFSIAQREFLVDVTGREDL